MKIPSWPVPIGSKPVDLELTRVFAALEKLGNPHFNLPPVIHVAGTNGKGSTIAFLKAILNSAGKKCHVYTSPHLVEFNERILIADEMISDEFLNEVLEETRQKCEGINLTFFEGTTVAAFLAFSKTHADFLLLETGMGGRLDATNVMGLNGAPDPLLTIITPISLDHMEFLGAELEKIAYEKASIIKTGVPCVVSKQLPEAAKVIFNYAKEKNSSIYCDTRDFSHLANPDKTFYYEDEEELMSLPKPGLEGEHQYMNAAAAIKAALLIGIDKQAIAEGITNVKWPARMQKLADNIYLDGGHNPAAAETVRDFVLEQTLHEKKKNIAIIGMLKTKDFKDFIIKISPAFDKLVAVPIPDEDYREPEEIKQLCDELKLNCSVESSVEAALEKYKTLEDTIVICGSLYLAGYVLKKLKTEPRWLCPQ